MPSIKKTIFAKLHDWVGSERPKRLDFVEDNHNVDRALSNLATNDLALMAVQLSGEYQAAKNPTTKAWTETILDESGATFCVKTSTPNSTSTVWDMVISYPQHSKTFNQRYVKDSDGAWTMEYNEEVI